MNVLIDSSAWIDFLNGFPSPETAEVEHLLGGDETIHTCGIVAMEVLQGLRRSGSFPRAVRLFESLVLLEPAGLDTYLRAAEIYRQLRSRGKTIRSTVDCLVVALAEANDCSILARDRDIQNIVDSQLVRVSLWIAP